MIHGRNLIIYEGVPAVAIAAAKSCTINKQAGTEETSSPSSATARTFVPGRTSWEVSVSVLVLAFADIILKPGQIYTLSWKERDQDFSHALSGTAICTDAQLEASVGNLARGSLKFVGTGDIASWTLIGDFNNDFNNDFLNS